MKIGSQLPFSAVKKIHIDYLVESQIVFEVDGEYFFHESMNISEAGENVLGGTSYVEQTIVDTLRFSEDIEWCGYPISGLDFADEYVDRYYDDFSSDEEYEESIQRYISCDHE